MENIYLQIAAEILKVSPDTFDNFPEYVRDNMEISVQAMTDLMKENLRLLYYTLQNDMCMGLAEEFMVKLSEETDYDLETLQTIDKFSQLDMYLEYQDNEYSFGTRAALEESCRQVEKALKITEIADVAKTLNTWLGNIKDVYSYDVCVDLCKTYRELQSKNVGGGQLIGALKDILQAEDRRLEAESEDDDYFDDVI